MVDTEDGASRLSIHAREVLRLMRMFGATPGQTVRQGVLKNLWARHLPRIDDEHLDRALGELMRAGVLTAGKPDGVSLTDKASASR